MHVFSVLVGRQPEKFLQKTEPKLRRRIQTALLKLRENPVPVHELDIKKINGMEHTYRIRISSHRIAYTVFWNEKKIQVFQIERRDEHTYD